MSDEPFTRAELDDLAEERHHSAQLEVEAEIDRDMPELDGEERWQEILRRMKLLES